MNILPKCPHPNVPKQSGKAIYYCSVTGCPYFAYKRIDFSGHVDRAHTCNTCGHYVTSRDGHECPKEQQTGAKAIIYEKIESKFFKEHKRAHRGAVREFVHIPPEGQYDAEQAMYIVLPDLEGLIKDLLAQIGGMKINMRAICLMARYKPNSSEDAETRQAYFSNKIPKSILVNDQVHDALAQIIDEIDVRIAEYQELGSGWRVKQVQAIEAAVFEYQPLLNAQGTGHYLPTPEPVRKGQRNPKVNKDCFKYATCISLFHSEAKGLASNRNKLYWPITWERYFDRLDWCGIKDSFVISTDLAQFEKKNKVRVNIYTQGGRNHASYYLQNKL